MILSLFFNFISTAQDSTKCKYYYLTLGKYEKRKTISINDVESCFKIIVTIVKSKCPIDEDFAVTPTIEHIIKKAKDENAVNYYFKYLSLQEGSAEEQLSFSFDSILSAYPRKLLEILSSFPDSIQIEFSNSLGWGFANNYYEEIKTNKLIKKEYYFSKHPGMDKFYSKYKKIIDHILIFVNDVLSDDKKNRK
jgi:hypothetical protein